MFKSHFGSKFEGNKEKLQSYCCSEDVCRLLKEKEAEICHEIKVNGLTKFAPRPELTEEQKQKVSVLKQRLKQFEIAEATNKRLLSFKRKQQKLQQDQAHLKA